MIEGETLTVRFAGVTPIDGVTVTFPGGTCGLFGPYGAGKTTVFNVLSGFVRPASGSIPRRAPFPRSGVRAPLRSCRASPPRAR